MRRRLGALLSSAVMGAVLAAPSASADTNYNPAAVCREASDTNHRLAATPFGVVENTSDGSWTLYCGIDRRGTTSADTHNVQVVVYDGSSLACASVRVWETNPTGTSTWVSSSKYTFDANNDLYCLGTEPLTVGNATVPFDNVVWHANGIMAVQAYLPSVDSSRRSALRGIFLQH